MISHRTTTDNNQANNQNDQTDNNNSDKNKKENEELDKLIFELMTTHRVYGYMARYKGIEYLSDGLRERMVALGVVSALMASILFPSTIDPPNEIENELILKTSETMMIIATSLCFINMAICTHHVAVLTSLISTEKDLIKFLINFGGYMDLPDIIMGCVISFFFTSWVLIIYSLYGNIVGTIIFIFIFVSTFYWIWEQQKEVALIKSMGYENIKVHINSANKPTNKMKLIILSLWTISLICIIIILFIAV